MWEGQRCWQASGGGCSLSRRVSSKAKDEGFNALGNRLKDGIEIRVIQYWISNFISPAKHFAQKEDPIFRYPAVSQRLKMTMGHAERDGPIVQRKIEIVKMSRPELCNDFPRYSASEEGEARYREDLSIPIDGSGRGHG